MKPPRGCTCDPLESGHGMWPYEEYGLTCDLLESSYAMWPYGEYV